MSQTYQELCGAAQQVRVMAEELEVARRDNDAHRKLVWATHIALLLAALLATVWKDLDSCAKEVVKRKLEML